MMEWCTENDCPYYLRPGAAEMQAHPPGLMYEYIPYKFIPATLVPNNEGLEFRTIPALPEGLTLVKDAADAATYGYIPGTIYGAPKEYADFVAGVSFKMYAKNIGDIDDNFVATANFTVKLAPRLGSDAELESNVNDLDFIPFSDGRNEKIDSNIVGNRETLPDQYMHIDADNNLFDSFWINGEKQRENVDYTHEDGSTTVTIMAKTIQNLDDGTYTAAAAFRTADGGSNSHDSELNIVAQNFNVSLDGSGENTGGDTGGNTGSDAGNDAAGNNVGSTDNTGDGTGTVPATTQTNNTENNTNNPTDGNIDDNIGGGEDAAGAAFETAPATDADSAVPLPEFSSAGAENLETADSEEAADTFDPANLAAPTENPSVSGLPTNENGQYYFVLDDSGAPLEMRIDIPIEDFQDFYIDNELLTRDVDYTARSGSTILTVAANRLTAYESGLHTLRVRFENAVVEFALELQKTAPDTPTRTRLPILPIAIAILLILSACAAIVASKKVGRSQH
jgi:hypothetical protein